MTKLKFSTALTALMVSILVLCTACSDAPSPPRSNTGTSAPNANNSVQDEPKAPTGGEISVGVRQDVGDYIIEIISYRLTQDRVMTTDHDIIVVLYEWTNNSGVPRSFDGAFRRHSAFQNGIACDDHIWQTPEANLSWRDVQSGYSQTVEKAYGLIDTTSPVTIEIGTPYDGHLTHTINIANPSSSESTHSPGAGDTATSNAGEVLYDGVPVLNLIGSRLADLRDLLGNPDFEGVVWAGGTYGYRYDVFGDFDGIVFNKSEQGEHIEAIWGNPAALTFNGTTLNMNRDGLVSLLGNPEDENWIEDYGIETYFILFINPEGIAMSFRLSSPNDRAHEFFISRY